jgi:hypothetical protein
MFAVPFFTSKQAPATQLEGLAQRLWGADLFFLAGHLF